MALHLIPATTTPPRYLDSIADVLAALSAALGRHPDDMIRRLPEWERVIRTRDGAVLGDAVDSLLAEWTDPKLFPTPRQFSDHCAAAHAKRFRPSRLPDPSGPEVFCRFCGTTRLFPLPSGREMVAHVAGCHAQHPSEREAQAAHDRTRLAR